MIKSNEIKSIKAAINSYNLVSINKITMEDGIRLFCLVEILRSFDIDYESVRSCNGLDRTGTYIEELNSYFKKQDETLKYKPSFEVQKEIIKKNPDSSLKVNPLVPREVQKIPNNNNSSNV
jgi:hypothetical protein